MCLQLIADNNNWSIYCRERYLDESLIDAGAEKLVKAGAYPDSQNKTGYYCSDTVEN
jgi:hypothetical protein